MPTTRAARTRTGAGGTQVTELPDHAPALSGSGSSAGGVRLRGQATGVRLRGQATGVRAGGASGATGAGPSGRSTPGTAHPAALDAADDGAGRAVVSAERSWVVVMRQR